MCVCMGGWRLCGLPGVWVGLVGGLYVYVHVCRCAWSA